MAGKNLSEMTYFVAGGTIIDSLTVDDEFDGARVGADAVVRSAGVVAGVTWLHVADEQRTVRRLCHPSPQRVRLHNVVGQNRRTTAQQLYCPIKTNVQSKLAKGRIAVLSLSRRRMLSSIRPRRQENNAQCTHALQLAGTRPHSSS